MGKVLVLFDSASGNTAKVAGLVAGGAAGIPGIGVRQPPRPPSQGTAMPLRSSLAALAVLSLLAPFASAQQDRYDVGTRLRLFERALEKNTDADAQKRAAAHVEKTTAAFFSGQLGRVAELLDLSRLALASAEKPTAEVMFASSLSFRPSARLLDTSAAELPVTAIAFYKTAGARPEKVEVRWSLVGPDGKSSPPATAATATATTTTVALGELPFRGKLALKGVKPGDYYLRSEVLVGGKVLAASEGRLTLADRLNDRLEALRKGLAGLEKAEGASSTEKATLARLTALLTDLTGRKPQETDYPAARLLAEAEAVLKALQAGKKFYTADRAGQFWLTLMAGEKGPADPVRLQVPAAAAKGKPLPVVVALHGAGGSENLFFDGYGDGKVAKLAAERGWLLVATRSPLFSLSGGPDPSRVVDALAKVYPVDKKKVFLVGHSMGAAQAVGAAGARPERYLAVAALGGGGRVGAAAGLKDVRFFVGVGDRDFALNGAKGLHAALTKAGVKQATYRVYKDVDHLMVVQLGLKDVFAFFDRAAKAE